MSINKICFYWFSRLKLVNDNPGYEQIFLNVKLEKINLNLSETLACLSYSIRERIIYVSKILYAKLTHTPMN